MSLLCVGEEVELFYTLRSPDGSDKLDSSYETILALPQMLCDQTLLNVNVKAWQDSYNIICVDPRYVGRSKSSPKEDWDLWQAAADDALMLPKVHLFASMATSANLAMRLACLWPEKLATLRKAISPPSPKFEPAGTTAKSVSEWEEATLGYLYLVCGERPKPTDLDMFAEAFAGRYGRFDVNLFLLCQASWYAVAANMRDLPLFKSEHRQRRAIPADQLAKLSVPTLFVQGGNSDAYRANTAYEYASHMPEAHVQIVKDAGHGVAHTHADVVNLLALGHFRQHALDTEARNRPVESDFAAALARLGSLNGVATSARDPKLPSSYSMSTSIDREVLRKGIEELQAASATASPVSLPYGQTPIWSQQESPYTFAHRFSERHSGIVDRKRTSLSGLSKSTQVLVDV